MGTHYRETPKWWQRKRYLIPLGLATVGAAYLSGHSDPDPYAKVQLVPQAIAASRAQKFANDVIGQCNINPLGCTTQEIGEAREVAETPIHDGVDGKDGKDGVDGTNGVNGKDGHDGKNGVNGSPAKEAIYRFPWATYACPRTGGSDLAPFYDCSQAQLITKGN